MEADASRLAGPGREARPNPVVAVTAETAVVAALAETWDQQDFASRPVDLVPAASPNLAGGAVVVPAAFPNLAAVAVAVAVVVLAAFPSLVAVLAARPSFAADTVVKPGFVAGPELKDRSPCPSWVDVALPEGRQPDRSSLVRVLVGQAYFPNLSLDRLSVARPPKDLLRRRRFVENRLVFDQVAGCPRRVLPVLRQDAVVPNFADLVVFDPSLKAEPVQPSRHFVVARPRQVLAGAKVCADYCRPRCLQNRQVDVARHRQDCRDPSSSLLLKICRAKKSHVRRDRRLSQKRVLVMFCYHRYCRYARP